jgi:hypothetical protein
MRTSLSSSISRHFLVLGLIAVGCAFQAHAQQQQGREAHVISARAGGINFVSGEVRFQHKGRLDWRVLTAKDDLSSGDVVETGTGGRVEVLLNPGSYLRLGENSEFELTDASLDALRIRLLKGSAVVEATGYDDTSFLIVVNTPQTATSIVRSGIYRFNVLPTNVTEVYVRKGRVVIGDNQKEPVKKGRIARVSSTGVEVAKFDKKNKDALDVWSKERAENLAEANRKLSQRNVNALLAMNASNNFFTADRTFGLWFWNGRSNCYTFLPFYVGWRSPYGSWYGSSFGVSPYVPGCYSCGYVSTRGGSFPVNIGVGTPPLSNASSSSPVSAPTVSPSTPINRERNFPSMVNERPSNEGRLKEDRIDRPRVQ